MVTSYERGWLTYYDFNKGCWRYADTNRKTNNKRPCKRCGLPPTKEGYDACLGEIKGAISACCGHGVIDSFIKRGKK